MTYRPTLHLCRNDFGRGDLELGVAYKWYWWGFRIWPERWMSAKAR